MPWFDSLKWIFDGLNIHIIKRFVVYACAFFPYRFFKKNRLKIDPKKIHFTAATLQVYWTNSLRS